VIIPNVPGSKKKLPNMSRKNPKSIIDKALNERVQISVKNPHAKRRIPNVQQIVPAMVNIPEKNVPVVYRKLPPNNGK